MTKLTSREFVACPYPAAEAYLDEELRANGDRPLTLHVLPEGLTGVDLAKAVDATVAPGDAPGAWSVTWRPHGGGPFPTFRGELRLVLDGEMETPVLELTGEYEPPFGVAGKIFDAVAGSRVAAATGKALLIDVADRIIERKRSVGGGA